MSGQFNHLPHVLTPAECGKLCRGIRNLKHRAMVQLMYEGALRLNEVCTIRVKHLSAGQLFIEDSKGAKDRIVPVSDGTMHVLREYWQRYQPGTGMAYLFRSESAYGKGFAPRTLQNIIARAAVVSGIGRHVNPHLLRHSRATHWINAGMDIYHVAMLLGHASVSTTQIYLHTAVERLFQVTEEVNNIISATYQPNV